MEISGSAASFYGTGHLAECSDYAEEIVRNHSLFAERRRKAEEDQYMEGVERDLNAEIRLEAKEAAERKRELLSTWTDQIKDLAVPAFGGRDESVTASDLSQWQTPLAIFNEFFTNAILAKIVQFTNANGSARSGAKWIDTDVCEFRAVLGVLMYMGGTSVRDASDCMLSQVMQRCRMLCNCGTMHDH